MQSPITKQQLSDWKQNEVTRAYFNGIKTKIDQIAGFLAGGGSLGENVEQDTAKMVGQIQGLIDALDVELETVVEGDQE